MLLPRRTPGRGFFSSVSVLLIIGTFATAQTTLDFKPEPGGGWPIGNPQGTIFYRWHPDEGNFWYNGSSGGQWVDGSIALFRRSDGVIVDGKTVETSYVVELTHDVVLGGVTSGPDRGGANTTLTGIGANPVTITFLEGAEVSNERGDGRSIIFGPNLKLVGDITVVGRADGQLSIISFTTEQTYTDTITVKPGAILNLGHSTAMSGAKIVMNDARAGLMWSAAQVTISELSGTDGFLRLNVSANASHLVVNQATDTNFGGRLAEQGSRSYGFKKDGVGTLVFNGNKTHAINGLVEVKGGSFYANGEFRNTLSNQTQSLRVNAGARFGGTASLVAPTLTLDAATSIAAPGMFDIDTDQQQIGTMTLGAGLTATEGGTFEFAIGLDGSGQLANSRFLMTGGALTLGADKTFQINLINLGVADLAAGNHSITLFQIGAALAIPTNLEAFVDQWSLSESSVPTGWTVDPLAPFIIEGRDVKLQFAVIPEPGTFLLLPLAGSLMLWMRRRQRCLKS